MDEVYSREHKREPLLRHVGGTTQEGATRQEEVTNPTLHIYYITSFNPESYNLAWTSMADFYQLTRVLLLQASCFDFFALVHQYLELIS